MILLKFNKDLYINPMHVVSISALAGGRCCIRLSNNRTINHDESVEKVSDIVAEALNSSLFSTKYDLEDRMMKNE